jgi:hypothetical protein
MQKAPHILSTLRGLIQEEKLVHRCQYFAFPVRADRPSGVVTEVKPTSDPRDEFSRLQSDFEAILGYQLSMSFSGNFRIKSTIAPEMLGTLGSCCNWWVAQKYGPVSRGRCTLLTEILFEEPHVRERATSRPVKC